MKLIDVRLYLLALVVGLLTGIVCVLFRATLSFCGTLHSYYFGTEQPWYIHLAAVLGIFGLLIAVQKLIHRYPTVAGGGMAQTEAILKGRLRYKNILPTFLAKFAGGVFSIGAGLSLGREGTSVQLGGYIGSWIAARGKVERGRIKHLVAAGAGAGASAAFVAPLASSILILESIEKLNVPRTAITTLLAGIVAGIFASYFYPISIYDQLDVHLPALDWWSLLGVLLLMSVAFALLGYLFSKCFFLCRRLYGQWRFPWWIKLGMVTVIIWSVCTLMPSFSTDSQLFMIEKANSPTDSFWVIGGLILLLFAYNSISGALNFPGGIFLPMMALGGMAGIGFAQCLTWFHIVSTESYGYFALIGMSACFIAVVRTPITAFILIAEMTGIYEVFFPTLIVGIFTYFLSELLGVPPLDKRLYTEMIANTHMPSRITLYFEVSEKSYIQGKHIDDLQLPMYCRISTVYRHRKRIDLNQETCFEAEDQVEIETRPEDIEGLYASLMGLFTSL